MVNPTVPSRERLLAALAALDHMYPEETRGFLAIDVRHRLKETGLTWQLVRVGLDRLAEEGVIHRHVPLNCVRPRYRLLGH